MGYIIVEIFAKIGLGQLRVVASRSAPTAARNINILRARVGNDAPGRVSAKAERNIRS
jgi:hypothetical protein